MDRRGPSRQMSQDEKLQFLKSNSEVDEDLCYDILEQTGWNLESAMKDLGLASPETCPAKGMQEDSELQSGNADNSMASWTNVSSVKPKKREPKTVEDQYVPSTSPNGPSLIKRYPAHVDKTELEGILRRELCFPQTNSLILKLGEPNANLTLVLIRGLSGSGKSTLGQLLASLGSTGVKLSADDYFMKRGVYKFDKNLLQEAHRDTQLKCKNYMTARATPIVIDNTNTEQWEMLPYVKWGLQYGYEIEIVEPNTKWKFDIKTLAKKNCHGVPKEALDRMRRRFDHNVTVKSLIQSAGGPVYLPPPQPEPVARTPVPREINLSDFVPLEKPKKSPAPETTSSKGQQQFQSFPNLHRPVPCKYQPNETNSTALADSNCVSNNSILQSENPRRAAIFPSLGDEPTEVLPEDFWRDSNCKGTDSASNSVNMDQNVFSGSSSPGSPPCTEEVRNYLKTMFPKQNLELLEEYWRSCGGDINYCCDLLLESGYGAENEVSTATSINKSPELSEWEGEDDGSLLGAVGRDTENFEATGDAFSSSVANTEYDSPPASADDCYVPIDGDDWLDLQLSPSFVSQLTASYSNPIQGTELSSLPEEFLKIKVPPKLAFKLFQLLSLNVIKKVDTYNVDQEREQIESDAKFAAFLSESEYFDAMSHEPTLVQISNLEVKVRDNQLWKAKESRDQIPIKFASLLKIHKLKACFPTLPENVVMTIFEESSENFELALAKIKSIYPLYFDVNGLSEKLECKDEMKYAVDKQLETLRAMQSSPEPDEKTGFEWRDISLRHYKLRQEYQEKVQMASRENQHFEVARHYAIMSATHNEQMNIAKQKAKEWFLVHFNQTGSSNKLDLHGQTTKDALQLLFHFIMERVQDLRNSNGSKSMLQIITGRGNNSEGGIARLRPAVKDYLNKKRLRYEEDSGQFFIHINHLTKL